MNIEEFREYCLSLPDVTEATPFEKFSRGRYTILGRLVRTIVFYVGGHMFCYFRSTSGRLLPTGRKNVDDFSNITIKCDSTEMEELKEKYQAVGDPFNGDKRYWISVQPDKDLPDDMLRELVRKSYEIVKSKRR